MYLSYKRKSTVTYLYHYKQMFFNEHLNVFFSSQRKFRHHHNNYYSCFVFSLYWPSTRTHMKLNIIIRTYVLYHGEWFVGLPVPNIDLST